ncbi:MAG: hypothetical protein K2O18_03395 [Oscillospiraceae bacterium]|nr:hypothetical protein [Oscillospiraceae bacterium]
MKNLICVLLSCVIVIAFAAASLSAEMKTPGGDPAVPVYAEGYTCGDFDELRMRKIYQLSSVYDIDSIPVEDFENNGQMYHFIGLEQVSGEGLEPYIRDGSKNPALYAAVFCRENS